MTPGFRSIGLLVLGLLLLLGGCRIVALQILRFRRLEVFADERVGHPVVEVDILVHREQLDNAAGLEAGGNRAS